MMLTLMLPLPLISRLGLGIGVYLVCLWWFKLIPRMEPQKKEIWFYNDTNWGEHPVLKHQLTN